MKTKNPGINKYLRNGCLLLSGLVLSMSSPLSGEEPAAQPLSIYPKFAVKKSEFTRFFNQHSLEGDMLVIWFPQKANVSGYAQTLDLDKSKIRFSLSITLPQFFTKEYNYAALDGFVYFPYSREVSTSINSIGDTNTLRNSQAGSVGPGIEKMYRTGYRRQALFHAMCQELNLTLTVGMRYEESRYSSKIKSVVTHADCLAIYAPEKLIHSPEKFRPYLEKTIKRARKKNPDIQIEICLPTGSDLETTQFLQRIIEETGDLADRFGIMVEDRPETLASFTILWASLRPENRELGQLAEEKLKYLQQLAVEKKN